MSIIDNLKQLFSSEPNTNQVAVVEPIDVMRADGLPEENLLVYLDTGEEHSQIDEDFAKELGLYSPEQVVDRAPMINPATGRERLHDQIEVSFKLAGEHKRSRWIITDRSDCKQLILIGKQDLRGLAVLVPEIET